MTTHEDYIPDAIQMVSAWEVPEEDYARVVNDQARLMAGMDLGPPGSIPVTSPYSSLQL